MVGQPIEGRYVRSGGIPCADCNTTSGYVPVGAALPRRTRGLCDPCYDHHLRRGTLDRYALATNFYARPTPRLKLPWQRRAARIAAIALRVARHEAHGVAAFVPVEEEDVDAATVHGNAERAALAWLVAHPDQLLGVSRNRAECGWPVGTEHLRGFIRRTDDAA